MEEGVPNKISERVNSSTAVPALLPDEEELVKTGSLALKKTGKGAFNFADLPLGAKSVSGSWRQRTFKMAT